MTTQPGVLVPRRKTRIAIASGLAWFLCAIPSLAQKGASSPTPHAPATSTTRRGDAISDPLLLLLRAPLLRSELDLRPPQIDALTQAVDNLDQALWPLRDLQFTSPGNSARAWQLVDQLDAALAQIVDPDQLARLRQLAIQALGLRSLLTPGVIHDLELTPLQVSQLSDILDQSRQESQKRPSQSPARRDQRDRNADPSPATQRKKILAILTDQQKRRWQQIAGRPRDFSRAVLRFARAPEIRGVETWINSAPLTLAALRGKVVALHFFTFGCINCVHNQPAYKDWHARLSGQGLVVLGIHTPETEPETNTDNVRHALQQQGLSYPVAVDNRRENWAAWGNSIWPAVYLVDKAGYVRYWWYGELNWQAAQGEKIFREKIAQLLAENADTAPTPQPLGSQSIPPATLTNRP